MFLHMDNDDNQHLNDWLAGNGGLAVAGIIILIVLALLWSLAGSLL